MSQLSRRIRCKLVDCTPVFTAVLHLVQIAGAAPVAGPTVCGNHADARFFFWGGGGGGGLRGLGTNIFCS